MNGSARSSLCAFAGLRLGEASEVRLGDADFLRRTLKVQRQIQRAEKGHVANTLPKYASERLVHIPDGRVQVLSAHVPNIGVHGEQKWLFLGDAGLPPHQDTSGYWWRKTVKAQVCKIWHCMTCALFYVSGSIAAGCYVVTVQRALGHSKATTTLNTSAHLWPTAEDRARAAANAMMTEALALSADSVRTASA